jgi:hypothetical protein
MIPVGAILIAVYSALCSVTSRATSAKEKNYSKKATDNNTFKRHNPSPNLFTLI